MRNYLLLIVTFLLISCDRSSVVTVNHPQNKLEVLTKTAESGDPKAQFELADFLEKERNDSINALIWYQKAADQNYAPAITRLACNYEESCQYYNDFLPEQVLKTNKKEAVRLCQKAEKQENIDALFY